MRIAIAGASGFIGRGLTARLAAEGHDIAVIGRRADALPTGPGIERFPADIADPDTLAKALAGADAAYYLVHSMGGPGFAARDRALAAAFGRAARDAGVGRIVYLGALGDGELSAHLASRREVGAALRTGGVPVVELRAAVILGAGSTSFEMMRALVERLPAMVCPRWVRTRIEPVSERDALAYLVAALEVAPDVYEIGCGEVTTYRAMMGMYAARRGLRPRAIVDVPLLTLTLSSYWVDLVTAIDHRVSHALIDSLRSEVVVRDHARTRDAFGIRPTPLIDAIDAALDDQATAIVETLPETRSGDGVEAVTVRVPLDPALAASARAELRTIGGSVRWYGAGWAWRLRALAGRAFGERAPLGRGPLRPGSHVDWWEVERSDPLVLRSRFWKTGDGWLAYRVRDDALTLGAAFRPRGIPGFLYWALLGPLHRRVFPAMAAQRVRRAERL